MIVFVCRIPFGVRPELTLEIELLYSNLERGRKKGNTDKLRVLESNPVVKKVVLKTYRINDPWNAVHQYVPISFDPVFFCSIDSVIHVMPFSYQLDPKGINKIQKEFFKPPVKINQNSVNAAYYALLDPLRISYDSVRNLCLLITNSMYTKSPDFLKCIPEDLKIPTFNKENSPKSFYELADTEDPEIIATKISEEIDAVKFEIENSFLKLIHLQMITGRKSIEVLRSFFEIQLSRHFHEYIKLELKEASIYRDNIEYHDKAEDIRRSPYYKNLEKLSIQSEDLYNTNDCHPIFFIENYSANGEILSQIQYPPQADAPDLNICKINDIHVMVLIHGYKGTSTDMHLIKGYIAQIYPDIHIMSSKVNEYQSDTLIGLQGYNLSSEIIQYISANRIPLHRLKISFLCHSLGGLIARAAMPHLVKLQENMFSFITFSSPHLGVGISDNVLLEIGKFFIKKYHGSDSFSQMTFHDSQNIKDSYIYELSQYPGLEWFENIMFFSCGEDPYVHEDSARIQVNPKLEYLPGYEEMISHILGRIKMEKVTRIDVHFQHGDVSKACICCGNRHIDFIDNPCFIKMVCYGFPRLFS